ncbi:MAG: hypothetical protein EOP68_19935, partial [Sphingomonas sp.]
MEQVRRHRGRHAPKAIASPRSTLSASFASVNVARAVLLLAASALAAPAVAQAGASSTPSSDFTTSLGTSYWHGDYGAPTNTSIWAGLFGVRYRTGGLRISAYLPYMRIKSDGAIFTGIGGTPLFVAPNVPTGKRIRKGFGDVTLGASYLLPNPQGTGLDVELTGRVKLPTASDKSLLSTGKTDYSAGVD